MPWIPEAIKKRACRYLLQRYLGVFLREKLTLDQLSVDLFTGTGTIKNVELSVDTLNELLESTQSPLEILSGNIGNISLCIPWSSLLKDNIKVEISDMHIVLQPKYRNGPADSNPDSMLDSMWASMSMTSSMALAEECLKEDAGPEQEPAENNQQPFDGIEAFAQTIESVLTRIKVEFSKTIIKLEHLPAEAKSGVALEIHIDRMEYFDEASKDQGSSVDQASPASHIYEPAAMANKIFHLTKLSLYYGEFTASQDANSLYRSSSVDGALRSGLEAFAFPHSPPLPPQHFEFAQYQHQEPQQSSGISSGGGCGHPSAMLSNPVLIAKCMGKQEVKVKIKQNDSIPGPKLEVDCFLAYLYSLLSPKQVHQLLDLFSGIFSTAEQMSEVSSGSNRGVKNKPIQPDDLRKIESDLQQQMLREGQERERQARGGDQPQPDWHSAEIDDAMLDYDIRSKDEDNTSELYFSMATSLTSLSPLGQPPDSELDSSFTSSVSTASTANSSRLGGVHPKIGGYYGAGAGYAFAAAGSGTNMMASSPFTTALPKGVTKRTHKPPKKSISQILDDPAAEVSQFNLRFGSFCLVLLHSEPEAGPLAANSAAEKMAALLRVSENYFQAVCSDYRVFSEKNFSKLRDKLSEACPYDHIQAMVSPVTIECEKKCSTSASSLSTEVSLGRLEVVECLYAGDTAPPQQGSNRPDQKSYTKLLTFLEEKSSKPSSNSVYPEQYGGQASKKSCLKISLRSVEKKIKSVHQRYRSDRLRTEVGIELKSGASCELDVTLVDRIHSLLDPAPPEPINSANLNWSHYPLSSINKQTLFREALDETSTDQKMDISINCPLVKVAIRFPIPDLRPDQGQWWKQNLRKEILLLEAKEAVFQTSFRGNQKQMQYEFGCHDLHVMFQEDPGEEPISLMRVSQGQVGEPTITGSPDDYDCPRFILKIQSQEKTSALEEELDSPLDSNNSSNSLDDACQLGRPEPSPFSTKRVMLENEEMVIPGDGQETNEFSEKTKLNSYLVLDFSLPNVNVFFPSKRIFELLYNRLANDFVLWRPLAPLPKELAEKSQQSVYCPGAGLDLQTQLLQASRLSHSQTFSTCRSALFKAHDSDEDEDSEESGKYYPTEEQRRRHHHADEQRHLRPELVKGQTYLALSVSLGYGKLAICSPLKDEKGEVSSDQHGELLLEVEDASLFVAINYKGDENLQYIAIQSNRAALYHSGAVRTMAKPLVVERALRRPLTPLDPCLYKSEAGLYDGTAGVGTGGDSPNMLSIAIKIDLNPDKDVEEFILSIGIRGATMQYRVLPSEQNWISQFMEFFTVVDEDILGYKPPAVLTQLHTHFWDCAVDYRPLYLPMRAILTIGTFTISSNIVVDAPVSLLRFIVEDAALLLSDKCQARTLDLKKNYVCVANLGLFELSLKTSSGEDKRFPKTDLQLSSNVLHISTCADSCSALRELVQYMAGDGDLSPPSQHPPPSQREPPNASQTTQAKTSQQPTQQASHPQPPQSPVFKQTHRHLDQMQNLMEEAMKELTNQKRTDIATDEEESHVDLFGQPKGAFSSLEAGYPDDDEFCILDSPGLGVTPRTGEPEVRVLTPSESIQLKENHFSQPEKKTDQLKAPDHFPPPLYRYTLKEITLVWHMYGGNDFTPSKENSTSSFSSSPSSKKNGSSSHHSSNPRGVPASYHLPNGNQMAAGGAGGMRSKAASSWQARGGPGRNHDVLMELQMNKVRIQCEKYAEGVEQASRQILLVNDMEVRDRLAQSQINKFLYQYSSEARPKKTYANMILVKMVNVRPDPSLPTEECSLRVSIQPLRLNIDQDSVFFLREFFHDISKSHHTQSADADAVQNTVTSGPGATTSSASSSQRSTPTPVMRVGSGSSLSQSPVSSSPVLGRTTATATPPPATAEAAPVSPANSSPTLGGLLSQSQSSEAASAGEDLLPEETGDENTATATATATAAGECPTFFRSFVFSPEVPIRLDYEGKHMVFDEGTIAGILIGLAQLNCSELTLKRLHFKHGLLGTDKLVNYALNEWVGDIKKNQLPSILGGVGPMYSLVQLFQGLVDLVKLPVEQYQKDGRIVRGLQRGAHSFSASTTMAALELTNRFVQAIQGTAEFAYDMLSPGPSVSKHSRIRSHSHGQNRITAGSGGAGAGGHFVQHRLAQQPADIREGMANAYQVVTEGIGETADTLVRVAREEHDQKGVTGALGGVLRQIPPTVIRPVILLTEATSSMLGGVHNQLAPDARREAAEKWRAKTSQN